MGTKIKVWHIVLLSAIIGAGIAIALVVMAKKVDRLTGVANEANQQVIYYSIMVDSLKENVSEAALSIRLKEQEIIVTNEQIERLKAEKIKYLNAIGSLRVQLSAAKDSLAVKAPADTIIREVMVISDKPMIELPLSFDYNDRWISMNGSVDTMGMGTLTTVLGDTPVDIALGSKMFRRDYITAISSPNPYIQFDMMNIQLVVPKRTKTYVIIGGVALGFGMLGGAMVYHGLTK